MLSECVCMPVCERERVRERDVNASSASNSISSNDIRTGHSIWTCGIWTLYGALQFFFLILELLANACNLLMSVQLMRRGWCSVLLHVLEHRSFLN